MTGRANTIGRRIADDVYWRRSDGAGSAPSYERLADLIDEAVDAQKYRSRVDAEQLAKWLASALASGWEGESFKIRDMRRWIDDVHQALEVIGGKK